MDILADTSGAPDMLKNRAATLAWRARRQGAQPGHGQRRHDEEGPLGDGRGSMRSLGWSSLVTQARRSTCFAHASKAGPRREGLLDASGQLELKAAEALARSGRG